MSETQQLVAHYTWSGAAPPPADGQFCSDSRNWSAATQLVFSELDNTGQNLDATFSALAQEDTLRAEQGGNPGNWRLWAVGGPPAQAPDMTWTVPVTLLSSGGTNVTNGRDCYLVFTLATNPPRSLADWTMVEDDPSHWWSEVVCVHGTTRAGIWTQGQIVDDRNLLAQAQPAFNNHQVLLPECDCALNVAWTPMFVPPAPDAQATATASELEQRDYPTTGTATFSYQMMNAPSWYAGFVDCWHGQTLSGIWLGGPPPPMPGFLSIEQQMLQNHHGILYGCACTYAAAPPSQPTATMSIPQQTGIQTDMTVALIQTGGTLPTGFVVDGFGRLSATRDAVASIEATFYLLRSVAQGGGGFAALRLPDASTPNLTAPSAQTAGLIDGNDHATATLSWTGQIVANTSFELNYWNGSQLIQDVQGGSLTVTLT